MIIRPRRLRKNETIRNMVAETAVNPDSLVYPMFVVEGEGVKEEIPSMPGQFRFSIDEILKELESCVALGIKSILLFGIPHHKDEMATCAYDDDGIVQRAVRSIKAHFPDLYVITDVCLCEYMSHGHCGLSRTATWITTRRWNSSRRRRFRTRLPEPTWLPLPTLMDGRVGADPRMPR
jgi:Delta-aminolevulinic acid dehydratase